MVLGLFSPDNGIFLLAVILQEKGDAEQKGPAHAHKTPFLVISSLPFLQQVYQWLLSLFHSEHERKQKLVHAHLLYFTSPYDSRDQQVSGGNTVSTPNIFSSFKCIANPQWKKFKRREGLSLVLFW